MKESISKKGDLVTMFMTQLKTLSEYERQLEKNEKEQKEIAKRLWQKGYNAHFIADIMDKPIKLARLWVFHFEEESD